MRLLEQILGRIQLLSLRAEGTFGFPDPADTGAVYGVLTPLLFAGPRSGRARLRVRPAFDRVGVSGMAELRLRVRPIVLAGPLLVFMWRVAGSR